MNTRLCVAVLPLILSVACAQQPLRASDADAGAGIDSLNARLVQSYRDRDSRAYASLYTESGVFEWPAFNTVRGRAALEALARSNMALTDMELKLTVSSRKFAPEYATEFGAFQQSWRDTNGVRMAEYGRYVTGFARQRDNSWLIDHFFGFSDSTRPIPPPARR